MPQDAPFPSNKRPDLAWHCWLDPVLAGAFLVVALLVGFQLAALLLRPPWLGPVNAWLLAVLAWLELLGVVLFSWWASCTHMPAIRSW